MAEVDKRIQAKILEDIVAERLRQDELHGTRNGWPPERWLVILMEEVGEVSNAVLEHDLIGYYKEFIEVAAVAVAALENLCLEIAKEADHGPTPKA